MTVDRPFLALSQDLPNQIRARMLPDGTFLAHMYFPDSPRHTGHLPFSEDAFPHKLVTDAVRMQVKAEGLMGERREQCVAERSQKYILKVCGTEEYLIGQVRLSQFKVSLAWMLG